VPFPATPWRVADETPVCDRVKLLNDLAADGTQYASVKALADWVYRRALYQCEKFSQAAKNDPQMQNVMRNQQWFARMLALEALRAAQSLPYVHDPTNEEWIQTANFTLTGNSGNPHGGDCKDLTIVLVAVERLLGLQAEPYWITQNGQTINHVTSRVKLDGKWFWADPSIRGAMLGESPYEAEARLQTGVTGGLKSAAGIAPAGKGGGGGGGGKGFGGHFGGFRGRNLFGWWGWNGLWGGWPNWWWCLYYPYLCYPYGNFAAYPYAYGFYPIGAARLAYAFAQPAYDGVLVA